MPYDGPVNDEVLHFDPLTEAEAITEERYEHDEGTSALGAVLMRANNADKERRLKESNDTYFHQPIEKYLEVVRDLGFKEALAEQFTGNSPEFPETYYLFWHPDAILLSFDTYHAGHVNGGNLYYNWVPASEPFYWWTSSGGGSMVDGEFLWAGDHDAREALRYHLTGLRDHGRFVSPWKRSPLLFLGHYAEKRPSFKEWGTYREHTQSVNNRYLERLPEEARALFTQKLI